MFKKLKANKGKIIGTVIAALGGAVFYGAVATFFDESVGYSTLAAYLYGLAVHLKVAKLLESKIK